jgi:hypothetical protein
VGFVVEKLALGEVFTDWFGLPCQFSFHRLATPSSSIIRGWHNRPISGARTKWPQSHPTPGNYKKNYFDPKEGRLLTLNDIPFSPSWVTQPAAIAGDRFGQESHWP